MKNIIPIFLGIMLLCINLTHTKAQQKTLNLILKEQPQSQIILGWIKGDNFFKIDSTKADNGYAKFNFPGISKPGMYRVILGQTTYSRVMNEAPKQFDFIYNNEDIALKTNFTLPTDSMNVIRSEENKIWFNFIKKHKQFQKRFTELECKTDNFWIKKDTANALNAANVFNQLQMEWDLQLVQTIQQNQHLMVSKILRLKRTPILDGFLSPEERKETQKNEFFRNVNFNDPALINSSAYSDKIFEYLVLFNHPDFTQKQRTEAYTKAVDTIMPLINQNAEVYTFLKSYLLHGFKILQMEELITHINENY